MNIGKTTCFLLTALAGAWMAHPAFGSPDDQAVPAWPNSPIRHVVVIFQKNVSFDHYFATYPTAANDGSGPNFTAKPGTPLVNGLSPNGLIVTPEGKRS